MMKKILALLLSVALIAGLIAIPATAQETTMRPDSEIAVLFNGEYMEFDVDPVLINDRTMVPLRAIFEALGCDVSWDEETETATGNRNGIKVSVTIGSNSAIIAGNGVEIDQSAVLLNGRTLVPLRFISEAYGCKVDWVNETQTVLISAEPVEPSFFFIATNFTDLGTWIPQGEFIQGTSTGGTIEEADKGASSKDALLDVNIKKAGTYRLWVRARDYATNQPGSRYFGASIDGVMSPSTFGTHGKEGLFWQDGGTFELTEGAHKLHIVDTSGFFARCSGVFLTRDVNLIPPDDNAAMFKISIPTDPFDELGNTAYPAWAKANVEASKSESIENDHTKIVFYLGEGAKGSLVQTEIFVKNNKGEWINVKKKTEEFGFLQMYAKSTEFASVGSGDEVQFFINTVDLKNGTTVSSNTSNFYKSGYPEWRIPSDFEKVSDTDVRLVFPESDYAAFSSTISFDSLKEPKVTMNADFKKDGAYSYMFFVGDGVSYEDFDTVTSPLLHIKKYVPDAPTLTTECFMFTPMNTLYFNAQNNKKAPGYELTQGLVVDPTCVPQDFAYPNTSRFASIFRTPSNQIRSGFTAPCFGTEDANFSQGESYSFSYRIVNDLGNWYDTFTHVSGNMYNFTDLRTNYYSSINDSIYNVIDLMKDDYYGGWDDEAKGFYNMEAQDTVTLSNPSAILQAYLLTEDKEFLEKRVIPTIAFTLTRKAYHSKVTTNTGGASGYKGADTFGSPITQFGTSVYGGMYEMTQGRMPYLLDYAITTANRNTIQGNGAMYKYTGNKMYYDNLIATADRYIENNALTGENYEKRYISGFIYGDYIPLVSNILAAYELTGEKKYLDAANKHARYLALNMWTTGYQNDYATTDYHIDPDQVYERTMNSDNSSHFYWHGSVRWRPGAPKDVYKKAKEMDKVPEETVPGWLPAKAGLGTEHPRTPGHGNVITMNNWTGSAMVLAELTGDDFYKTMANNASIGRYGNYPGYYVDRYMAHYMHEDFPYVGPDYTNVYWHHIPVFLGILQDYLISSAWNRSHGNIDFPKVYQLGYAYFYNAHYGQEAGKFFDVDDMWLWLDRGIIQTDNVNIDYVAARKDGVLGLGLMNEDNKELTTTVKLGDKVPGGAGYTGTATLYDEWGTKSTVEVKNGEFTVTIPSKALVGVEIKVGVKAPSWSKDYTYSNAIGETVSTHVRGNGYVLQMNDDEYYAFIGTADIPDTTKSIELTYTVNGKTQNLIDNVYPFEFIVKVDDVMQAFEYKLTATKADGTKEDMGGATLKTLNLTNTQPSISMRSTVVLGENFATKANLDSNKVSSTADALGNFTPFAIKIVGQGTGAGKFRFVVNHSDFPFELSANCLSGLVIKGTLDNSITKQSIPFESIVTGNEMRETQTVLLVESTNAVPVGDYSNVAGSGYSWKMTVYPAGTEIKETSTTPVTPGAPPATNAPETPATDLGSFDPVKIVYKAQGTGTLNGKDALRIVCEGKSLPFKNITTNMLEGLKVKGTFTDKVTKQVLNLDSVVLGNEVRDNGDVVLIIEATAEVPKKDYDNDKAKTHAIEIYLHPAK